MPLKSESMNTNGSTEVVLLSPPYDFPPRPSIALSLFKSCLSKAGIQSKTLYTMFRMSELMGEDNIRALINMPPKAMCEEYIFSGLNGLENKLGLEDYITFVCSLRDMDKQWLKGVLQEAISAARQIVEETAQEIVAISPRVLAVSSVFFQLNASIAIIKRVKELSPDIKTLIGGPNCMGEAGVTILRYFPAVDAVFFGEGDEVFAEAVRALEDDGPLPYGVLRREDISASGEGFVPPFRLTQDMNKVPMADYSDFFVYLKRVPDDMKSLFRLGIYGPNLELMLLIEGSRGCWWGQKRPCSFCALNGVKNVYRKKDPERIFKELTELVEKYNTPYVEFTDNVLPTEAVKELLPLMESSPHKFVAFAEVKPIFNETEIFAFRRAGFIALQAGIETLNDHLLKLLNKGGSTVNNICFLKNIRHAGIKLYWNMLFRIPGEQIEDYEEMISLMPLLYHLPPPTGYTEIVYERRGAYIANQESYGIKAVPMAGYRYLYGDNEDIIDGLAMHYDDAGKEEQRMCAETRHLYDPLADIITEWSTLFRRKESCHLLMEPSGEHLVMTDTRPCRRMTICFLKGIAKKVCLLCNVPKAFDALFQEIREEGENCEKEELLDCLNYLIENRYLVHISGKYLTLAINKK